MDDESFDEEINLESIMFKEKIPQEEKKPKEKPKNNEHVPEMPFKMERKMEKKSSKKHTEKPTDDDIKKKRQLILHLSMYLNQFEELKSFKKVNLEKKSIEELQDLLKEFHVIMDSKSDLKSETQALLGMLNAYEYIMVGYAGVQCNGLTVALAQDEDTLKQIKLLILKHSPIVTLEPEHRLIMKILVTTFQLHTINTFNQQLTQQGNNNGKIEIINEKFNDI